MKVKDFKKDFGAYMKQYGQRGIELYERGLITLDEAVRMAHEAELDDLADDLKQEVLTNILGEEVVITEQEDGTVKAEIDGNPCHTYVNHTFGEVVDKYYWAGFAF